MLEILPEVNGKEKKILDFYSQFFQTFRLSQSLKISRIQKSKGVPITQIFRFIFLLPFTNKTGNRTFDLYGHLCPFHKDVMYRFLSETTYQWKKFLLRLSTTVIHQFFKPLTGEDRMDVLILDDTSLHRERSKKAEYLSWVFDHLRNHCVKGYQMLTLLWSDGNSSIPLSFSLHGNRKKLVSPALVTPHTTFHPLSHAYQIREQAWQEKTETGFRMIGEALKQGIRPKFVLFDSWYSFPKFYKKIKQAYRLHSICMVKKMPKVFYGYEGQVWNLEKLYAICRKKYPQKKQKRQIFPNPKEQFSGIVAPEDPSQNQELYKECMVYGSLVVTAGQEKDGTPVYVKIVFVQNRNNKRDWLAILSTDPSLDNQEIIRIYGKRWNIEVFFKILKELLHAEDEFQLIHFDSIYAHLSIIMARYCMLSWMDRKAKDDRSLGDLFYQCCEELMDLRIIDALHLCYRFLLQAIGDKIQVVETIAEELYRSFLSNMSLWCECSRVSSFCEV